ncbi:MAG TPA: helix-turn-helix domain-containing protein [Cyanobacteria bacterium UBA8803]|nr:helix-turn-helix domain-containing protein [Cyanobacteria bacterium UBA9273]HBL59637.1 helix-turn-helix domain-containing protein [Cyanobacteria bacterium UBA8803]
MSGVVKINITESPETLKTLLSQQKHKRSFERIQALYLLKTGQVETVQHLATVIGRHRTTIQGWLRRYRQGGIPSMLEMGKSSGRPSAIPDWAVERLSEELKSSKGFSSYGEVKNWLEDALGVKANYDVVHKLVRYKLKSKLKLVRRRSSC